MARRATGDALTLHGRRPGLAWEGLPAASGSGSLPRLTKGGSPNPVGGGPAGDGRQSQPRGQRPRRAAGDAPTLHRRRPGLAWVRLPAASASGSLARLTKGGSPNPVGGGPAGDGRQSQPRGQRPRRAAGDAPTLHRRWPRPRAGKASRRFRLRQPGPAGGEGGPAPRGKGFPPLPAPAAGPGGRRSHSPSPTRGGGPGFAGQRAFHCFRLRRPGPAGGGATVPAPHGAAARPCVEKGFPLLPAPAVWPGCGRPEAQGRRLSPAARAGYGVACSIAYFLCHTFPFSNVILCGSGKGSVLRHARGTSAKRQPVWRRRCRSSTGGAKAGAVCARQQAKSGRPPSRPVRGGGLRAYRPRFLFCAAFRHRRSQNHNLLQATGDRAGRTNRHMGNAGPHTGERAAVEAPRGRIERAFVLMPIRGYSPHRLPQGQARQAAPWASDQIFRRLQTNLRIVLATPENLQQNFLRYCGL